MARYGQDFYDKRQDAKVRAARLMLAHLGEHVGPIERAVDLGCGVGTWLAELSGQGCQVQGYDGPWVSEDALRTPPGSFERIDLSQPLPPPAERFDLAISLEVAEHLPESSAPTFVDNLVGLSDLVLFSAAVPGQGGTHHCNEQWPSYWRELFGARGYEAVDLFRGRFWNDPEVPVWYRQNMFVYAHGRALQQHPALEAARQRTDVGLMDVVHPELYGEKSLLPFRQVLPRLSMQLSSALRRLSAWP